MATNTHISKLAALVAALAAVALGLPAKSQAYGWPVKPFHVQHPVRGFFGDPRITYTGRKQFHFGIDISAKNGTAVYATLSGRVYVENEEVVTVVGARGLEFSYWHVIPTVRTGQSVTAYRTVIGHILKPNGHVHLSEAHNGVYVNPLRRGALAPFADHTKPIVRSVRVERAGRALMSRLVVSGSVDLVARVADTTPLPVRRPWFDMPVVPALVRWRIVGLTHWAVAADFRRVIPGPSAFHDYYATWTHQNRPGRAGRYGIYLRHGWDSTTVEDGSYTIEVVASDTRGNRSTLRTTLRVANGLRDR
jgi:hypothetical protein